MLDIDHGTYPFVTSSNPVAGSATIGAGVGPKDIGEVWGVTKAYATRVGAGPFASELNDELGARLREAGGEYGTTTGRARRTGWLDLVALRYAARVNGLTALAITKLDVLTGIGQLQVATRYRGPEGAEFDTFPYHQSILHKATAVYESLPGWDEDITEVRRYEDLPDTAQNYLHFIENFVGVPIVLVGVGPARDQVIEIDRSAPLQRAAGGRRDADRPRATEAAWNAYVAGDLDGVVSHMAPSVEVDMTNFVGWPEDAIYYGHSGFKRFITEWIGGFERYEAGVDDLIEVSPGCVLASLAAGVRRRKPRPGRDATATRNDQRRPDQPPRAVVGSSAAREGRALLATSTLTCW